MAKINFVSKKSPSVKSKHPVSRKWKKLLGVSIFLNVLLVLTTVYMVVYK